MKTIISRSDGQSCCFKVSLEMYEFITDLVKKGDMWSFSEGLRFALMTYLFSNPNPTMHIPKYFSRAFYSNKATLKKSISVKLLPKLNNKLNKVAKKYKLTRSEILRLALDHCSEYFLDITSDELLILP
jgi:hypothetical protein